MEKLHTKGSRSGQSSSRSGETLSNKVQPNLLFDYKRERCAAKQTAPPDSRQRVASWQSGSRDSAGVGSATRGVRRSG